MNFSKSSSDIPVLHSLQRGLSSVRLVSDTMKGDSQSQQIATLPTRICARPRCTKNEHPVSVQRHVFLPMRISLCGCLVIYLFLCSASCAYWIVILHVLFVQHEWL